MQELNVNKSSVHYAAVVIFLEFFAFGLLTTPMVTILDETFPKHTLLFNGLIQGIRGIFAFIGAPIIGSLSDIFGRKPFLFLTVTFTCCPIPFMKISQIWYFIIYCLSGVFSVTFSVIFAYVADITNEKTRNKAYGTISATFAASLVTSPAIGAYLGQLYSETFVVVLATFISIIDVAFIYIYLPESLPKNLRKAHSDVFQCKILVKLSTLCCRIFKNKKTVDLRASTHNMANQLNEDFEAAAATLKQADPFSLWKDKFTVLVCITTFLSYLPEAGQYSCFIVYLKLLMNFSEQYLALFIAFLGLTSCLAQTVFLTFFIRVFGHKQTIILGLIFEAIQLALYGFVSSRSMIWVAGGVASMSTITYPALSAYLSHHVSADVQGVAQGCITGIRGLCSGLGPALFGFIFYIFNVDLNKSSDKLTHLINLDSEELRKLNVDSDMIAKSNETVEALKKESWLYKLHKDYIPGPPFAVGAFIVLMAVIVSYYIPASKKPKSSRPIDEYTDIETKKKTDNFDMEFKSLLPSDKEREKLGRFNKNANFNNRYEDEDDSEEEELDLKDCRYVKNNSRSFVYSRLQNSPLDEDLKSNNEK